jgi:hypothetical protein
MYTLEHPKLELRHNWQLDTRSLEAQIIKQGGPTLDIRTDVEKLPLHNPCTKLSTHLLPILEPNSVAYNRDAQMQFASKRYLSPCAKRYKTPQEIMNDMLFLFNMAHQHYVVAKSNSSDFPSCHCGDSTRRIVTSSILLGYENATHAFDVSKDHSFAIFPFILNYKNITMKGSIVLDPTFDQYFNAEIDPKPLNARIPVRNPVILKLQPNSWVHEVKQDLQFLPNWFCHAQTFKRHVENGHYNFHNGYGYDDGNISFFQRAFANPKELPIINLTQ